MAEAGKLCLRTVLNNTVFSKLDIDTQEKILAQNIVFQGENMALKDVLTPSRAVDFDELIDSELLSRFANNEIITVGVAMDLSVADLCPYYVCRSVDDGEEILSDKQLCEYEETWYHSFTTVMNPPGSGKSTVLDNIAVNLKKNHSYLWVIKIDLKNYTEVLSTFKETKTKTISIIDVLNSRRETEIKDGLERKIFNIFHKVVLFVDGIDEVPSDYIRIITDFISAYRKDRNLARVYVASSNNIDKLLQKQLWSSRLVDLSEENQLLLFKRFLETVLTKNVEKCEMCAANLVKQKWFREDENTPIGVPLQIRMVAEVLCGIENLVEEIADVWEGYYEFLSLDNTESSMAKKINLARLYLLYIHQNCCDNKSRLNEISLREDMAKFNEKCENSLYITALEEILTKKQCELFDCYQNRLRENCKDTLLLKIVKKVGDHLRFSHRTMAEYFLADCIASELHLTENKDFLKFFIETILTKNEFRLVRLFLDSLIGCVLNSVSDKTLESIGFIVTENNLTYLHHLLQEGCIEIFKFLFECTKRAGLHLDFDIVRLKGETLLQTAISAGHFHMMEFLVGQGACVKARDDNEQTALQRAVNKNNLSAVKFLVQYGAEINCRDVNGRTPLHEAAVRGSLEMVEYLLSQGADVECSDKQCLTPLHEAVKSGDINKVKCLVENNADVNSRAKTGTPLFDAVSEGHVDIVKYLLENGADVTSRNADGGTVLHKPSKYRNYGQFSKWIKLQDKTSKKNAVEILKLLIDSGADVNAVDKRDSTPLHSHTDKDDNVDLIKHLAENGAEMNRKTKNGQTALSIAVQFGATEIAKYLMENGTPVYSQGLLFHSVDKGYLDVVKYFAEKGLYGNFLSEYYPNLLHSALQKNDFEAVKYLVEKGVDVNAKAYRGLGESSALKKAIANNCSIDIINTLLECGAKIESTALQLAAGKGNFPVVKLLQEKGAMADAIHCVGGNFPMLQYLWEKGVQISPPFVAQSAAERGDLNIIKYLIDKGVDVYKTRYGDTLVLHKAAKHDHLHIVQLLLKHGADLHCKDFKGETALNKAFRHGNLEIAEFLVRNGADIKNVLSENPDDLSHYIYLFDKMKFLVDHLEKVNIYGKLEKYVFVAALKGGYFDVAEYLVEKSEGDETVVGVVKRLRESEDNQLLDLFNRWDTVRYLLERGMRVSEEEIEKYDLLIRAASGNDFKYVKYLVEKGADVNRKDKEGYTALHKTSDFGIAKYLVGRGADVNAKTNEGLSVLHGAVKGKNLDLKEFLVENGADIHAVDDVREVQ